MADEKQACIHHDSRRFFHNDSGFLRTLVRSLKHDETATLADGTIVTAKELWLQIIRREFGDEDHVRPNDAYQQLGKLLQADELVVLPCGRQANRLQLVAEQHDIADTIDWREHRKQALDLLLAWTAPAQDDEVVVVVTLRGALLTRKQIRKMLDTERNLSSQSVYLQSHMVYLDALERALWQYDVLRQ